MDNKTDNQPGDRQGKKRQGQIRVSLHIYKKLRNVMITYWAKTR